MHDTTLWAEWYLLFLALPVLVIVILIREWSGRYRITRLR